MSWVGVTSVPNGHTPRSPRWHAGSWAGRWAVMASQAHPGLRLVLSLLWSGRGHRGAQVPALPPGAALWTWSQQTSHRDSASCLLHSLSSPDRCSARSRGTTLKPRLRQCRPWERRHLCTRPGPAPGCPLVLPLGGRAAGVRGQSPRREPALPTGARLCWPPIAASKLPGWAPGPPEKQRHLGVRLRRCAPRTSLGP